MSIHNPRLPDCGGEQQPQGPSIADSASNWELEKPVHTVSVRVFYRAFRKVADSGVQGKLP